MDAGEGRLVGPRAWLVRVRAWFGRVRAWFGRVPGRDALERRQAELLQIVLAVLAAVFALASVSAALRSAGNGALSNGVAAAISVALLAVLRRGQFRLVALLSVALLVVGFSSGLAEVGVAAGGGYLGLLMLPVVLAGLVLPRLLLAAATLGVLIGGNAAARLHDPAVAADPALAGALSNFQIATVLLAILVDQFGGTLRAALARATAHEQELETARSDLQARTTELQARTTELQTAVQALEAEMAERQRMEEERRAMEARVLEVQKLESLGVLAGGIAHDFNNLLVGIMGNAGLALMDLPPESPARSSIEQIETAARRAGDLAREMLAYSGKGRFVVAPVDVSELVREMTHLLQVSIGKSVTLRYDLAGERLVVEGDATQLRQVVMNLVVNASDAIGEANGIITVSTGRLHADRSYLAATFVDDSLAEGEYAYVEVSDTGIGMDAATQARIFDPFFTTKFAGRGLGLAAVLGIVRGHAGALKVYSEPGRGTTFKLLLPLAPATDAAAAAAEAAADWHGQGSVLVVDDEPAVRDITARILARLGLEVAVAADGEEGLALFRATPDRFGLVLLDLTMPRLSGADTFREIRAIRPDAAVILMSGYSEEEASSHFAGKGLAGFVEKPFTPQALTAAVRTVFERTPPAG